MFLYTDTGKYVNVRKYTSRFACKPITVCLQEAPSVRWFYEQCFSTILNPQHEKLNFHLHPKERHRNKMIYGRGVFSRSQKDSLRSAVLPTVHKQIVLFIQRTLEVVALNTGYSQVLSMFEYYQMVGKLEVAPTGSPFHTD